MATTVQNVIDGIKWGTDLQTGARLASADLIPEIDAAYKEAFEIAVAAYEDLYLKKVTDFAVVGGVGANVYQITATDFWKLKSIQLKVGTTFGAPLPVYAMAEQGQAGGLSYRLFDDTVHFEPELGSAGTYRLWYVYAPADLTLTTDTLVDRCNGAIKRFVIDTVSVRVKDREEEDAGVLQGFRTALAQRIARMAALRNIGPRKIADTRQGRRFRFLTKTGYGL